jgi:type I restriction enzyme M protein
MRNQPKQINPNFEAYLDGFSPNVQEILDKFKFRNQIPTRFDADILYALIEKFLDEAVNLGPQPVIDADGTIRLAALDNHAMGTIFEELICRFNEENNKEAGVHFTQRDIVALMADLIFQPIADKIESGTYLVYDYACGTGGMLTVAEARLSELAKEHNKEVKIHLYGQDARNVLKGGVATSHTTHPNENRFVRMFSILYISRCSISDTEHYEISNIKTTASAGQANLKKTGG